MERDAQNIFSLLLPNSVFDTLEHKEGRQLTKWSHLSAFSVANNESAVKAL
jgi:hypothetical protein